MENLSIGGNKSFLWFTMHLVAHLVITFCTVLFILSIYQNREIPGLVGDLGGTHTLPLAYAYIPSNLET